MLRKLSTGVWFFVNAAHRNSDEKLYAFDATDNALQVIVEQKKYLISVSPIATCPLHFSNS